ncbi:MAG: septal ring lytic transglycosylase RlpA family protein [Gallionella sp.]|nr:septal ring lytic transglycosylase RlpA family protein [Gallionella sp.]
MKNHIAISLFSIFILTACGATAKHKVEMPSKPAISTTGGAYLAGDGTGADAPENLDAIPDAVIRNEPLHRYANRPYVALGTPYTPLTKAGDFKQRGVASWYGKKFHGQPTSSGENYDMYAMTAAHLTLPIPSYARVTNLANQKSVVVRINDRGPFLHERVIDLSYTAAYKLGIVSNGSAEVEVESLNPDVVITPIAVSEPVQSTPLENVTPPVAEAVSVVAPSEAIAAPQAADNNIYLQLGAFKTQQNAEAYLSILRSELSDSGKELKLINKDGLVRVHIGPYADPTEARNSAEGLVGKLGFKPMVVLP